MNPNIDTPAPSDNMHYYGSEYVNTVHGYVHKNDIPSVQHEPIFSKFSRMIMFYTIVITMLIIVFHISSTYDEHRIDHQYIDKSDIFSNKLTERHMPRFDIKNVVYIGFATQFIQLSNNFNKMGIHSIVVVDIYNNAIDIDLTHTKFIKKYSTGLNNVGELITINLGHELSIREIILLSKLGNAGCSALVALYNSDNDVIWKDYAFINSSGETTIDLGYRSYSRKSDISYSEPRLCHKGSNDEIILCNENILATKLKEDSEEYIGYEY